jgi:DNA mismatch repair protein MutS2
VTIKIIPPATVLLITGPNTGGKTVALKTAGLLSLMAQAGLRIPAVHGSRIPVFQTMFADIGDEQSIAQSLSTFSGHMRSIIRIVEAAGPGTLVLLDELGAGTDPTEGSALAQALLDHFIKAGTLVAATTHYAELKAYAHTAPGAKNASVEFDLETLSPTYRLTIGLPGRSQAFEIASRLGLPDALVADARSRLSETQRTFEATLARIAEVESETAESKERTREAEMRAGVALRAAADERRKAQQSRADTELRAREEAERLVAELRAELETARKALERGQLTAPAIDAVLERVEDRLARAPAAARTGRGAERATTPAGAGPGGAPVWRVGDIARSRSGGWSGRVAELDRSKRRATLEAGAMRVSVELDDLEAAGDGAGSGAGSGPALVTTNVAEVRASRVRNVPMSLDLRGARVEEALSALERYLEDASLAGLARVSVIHGLGTGALRDAVRSDSAAHPLVKAVRPGERGEGGDGVTVVELG